MLAKGVNFQIGDSGTPTETFTQVINLTEISFSGTSWSTETTTNHNATDPVESIVPTIRQDGTISLTISPFIPGNTQHDLLRTLSESGASNNFQFIYPQSSVGTFTFAGFVQSFGFETKVDGLYKASVTLQPSAAITDQAAAVTAVTVTDAQAGSYVTSESITMSATFDEVVNVTGTPRIAVVLNSGTVYATYASGSGTNVLSFSYTFLGGDSAGAGEMSITSPIDLNSGTIKDQGGNNATLTFTAPTTSTFTVN